MIEIYNDNGVISIETKAKSGITLDTNTFEVKIDDLNVVHPGEYEKSGILLEVKEYNNILFYSFTIESNHLVIITNDKFEMKEEILSFFGDVDILVIVGSKESAKIFENIEARLVVPFGEGKSIFLNTLGQHTEEVDSYKVKGEFSLDSTEFVNLK
ncbi:MAG: hypothetical protein PHS49_03745 [Candidatus Gracilibacteria bacterium]|nr:hypothetical protein [Candidatus Gracilibacteria bacterium]